jgi:hypothetical protein
MEAAKNAGMESNAIELPNGLINAPITDSAINMAQSTVFLTLSLFCIFFSEIKLSPCEHNK